MQSINKNSIDLFDKPVLGHPQGLFVLFFTEMWERFSFYGMRALLVLFLVSSAGVGGWNWTSPQALALYGTYTSMVYLTPILGGYIADRYIGSRKAVLIGAVIMTLGHVSMAIEVAPIFLYIGIGCLIVGNGFFKPNMTSIISTMYKDAPEKKDGAYTIFYMGVNAGSFLGIMLCGYIGESVGWSYGFGLAGIFMLLGLIQFYFSQGIFGAIGGKPEKIGKGEVAAEVKMEFEGDRLNPFTMVDKVLITITASLGLIWVINDPMKEIGGVNVLSIGTLDISNYVILTAFVLFIFLLFSRISRYPKITRNRMTAIVAFAFFMITYNASFEQAGGSMTIFASEYTDRILTGSASTWFTIIDLLITVIPILVINWVLIMLFKRTFKKYMLPSIVLASSFVFIWFIVIWKLNRDLNSKSYKIEFAKSVEMVVNPESKKEETVESIVWASQTDVSNLKLIEASVDVNVPEKFEIGSTVFLYDVNKKGLLKFIDQSKVAKIEKERLVKGKVVEIKRGTEVKATWFGILNSLFIIILAPLFSKWWESKFNPSASVKYGIGLILMGLGFGALALGAMNIVKGGEVVLVSMVWLMVAYLFHTLGELCISPVSLSYVSKLVPGRMIALMFGVWYIALAIGNKLAGKMGGQVEAIQKEHSMSFFFLIFTVFTISVGLLAIVLNPVFKKIMHGVK